MTVNFYLASTIAIFLWCDNTKYSECQLCVASVVWPHNLKRGRIKSRVTGKSVAEFRPTLCTKIRVELERIKYKKYKTFSAHLDKDSLFSSAKTSSKTENYLGPNYFP